MSPADVRVRSLLLELDEFRKQAGIQLLSWVFVNGGANPTYEYTFAKAGLTWSQVVTGGEYVDPPMSFDTADTRWKRSEFAEGRAVRDLLIRLSGPAPAGIGLTSLQATWP